MERVKGIEPSQPAWKAGALPLSYTRTKKIWSGRRDSNPRPSPWQGDALPLSHFRIFSFCLVEGTGFEPVKAKPTDLQSVPFGQLGNPSTSFWSWREESNPQPTDYKSVALPIELRQHMFGDPEGTRTLDLQRDRLAF